jgi:ribosomal protein S18 acetylase RimI-like enzyme
MMIRAATSAEDVIVAKELFLAYAAEWNLDLCFQNFESELADLPGDYAPPEGRLLLAWHEQEPAGCVALRKLSEDLCEMKRLYVKPAFRRLGLGKALAVGVIAEASKTRYGRMRLDTLARMTAAVALYEALGFRRIDAYRHNPLEDAVYMELNLISSR